MNVKNNITDNTTDETLLVADTTEPLIVETEAAAEPEEEGNAGCQVRRKIEDYLERRRYKDELGELS